VYTYVNIYYFILTADIARAESRFKGYFEGFLDESTGHDEHDEPMSAEDGRLYILLSGH
jgi:hypothetical protein